MLFKVMFDDQEISIVLSKITGLSNVCSDKIKCHIFVEGNDDGYNSTEPYSVVCERLNNALKPKTTSDGRNMLANSDGYDTEGYSCF